MNESKPYPESSFTANQSRVLTECSDGNENDVNQTLSHSDLNICGRFCRDVLDRALHTTITTPAEGKITPKAFLEHFMLAFPFICHPFVHGSLVIKATKNESE